MQVFVWAFDFCVDKTIDEAVQWSNFLSTVHKLTSVHRIIVKIGACHGKTLLCSH